MGVRGETGQCKHMRDRADMTSKQESKVPVTMRDFFFDDPFFKNSWEDFDKVRNAMFQESRDMWKKFDGDIRETACMNSNIMLEAPSVNQEITQSEARSLMRQDSKSRWEDGCSLEGGCFHPLLLHSRKWICLKRLKVKLSGC